MKRLPNRPVPSKMRLSTQSWPVESAGLKEEANAHRRQVAARHKREELPLRPSRVNQFSSGCARKASRSSWTLARSRRSSSTSGSCHGLKAYSLEPASRALAWKLLKLLPQMAGGFEEIEEAHLRSLRANDPPSRRRPDGESHGGS